MTLRAWFYLAVTLGGLGLTQFHLVCFVTEVQGQNFIEGLLSFDIAAFIAGATANPAARFFAVDVVVAGLCFFGWLFPEAKRLKMRGVWIYVVLTFAVALAVSLPLFMFMRERALQRQPLERG